MKLLTVGAWLLVVACGGSGSGGSPGHVVVIDPNLPTGENDATFPTSDTLQVPVTPPPSPTGNGGTATGARSSRDASR